MFDNENSDEVKGDNDEHLAVFATRKYLLKDVTKCEI